MACPLCSSTDVVTTVRRERLPVMQNVVYPSRSEALSSPCAAFELGTCASCGFSFNALFDASLLRYDAAYDNDVASAAFLSYYQSLAGVLAERFNLQRGGIVYEVGCGKGTFLEVLSRAAPAISCVGIDPSCQPGTSGKVTLVRDLFSPHHFVSPAAKVILLRHVLEHIEHPVEFLVELRNAAPNVPLFVEVPDAAWILEHGAFWDFCYEHVNYFTHGALKQALTRAGYRVQEQVASFRGQYQWAICTPGAESEDEHGSAEVEAARSYAARESALIEAARTDALRAKAAHGCIIWGMATKGVVLSNILGPDIMLGGVDSNPRKQGHFAPGSGMEIHSPAWLRELEPGAVAFVMNPNYLEEIRSQARDLGVTLDFRAM